MSYFKNFALMFTIMFSLFCTVQHCVNLNILISDVVLLALISLTPAILSEKQDLFGFKKRGAKQ